MCLPSLFPTMALPDGKYELDLLIFSSELEEHEINSTSIAVRYGFIPDSMDQTRPLNLYQSEQACVLEAQLIEKSSKSAHNPNLILFEGVRQRQRGTAAASNDSYFLSFRRSLTTPDLKLELKKLGSTIRVSKTRNVEKWRKVISSWGKTTQNSQLGIPLEVPEAIEDGSSLLSFKEGHPQKPRRNDVQEVPGTNTKSRIANKKQPSKLVVPPKKRISSKRPPSATPENQGGMIGESKFENLESESDDNIAIDVVTTNSTQAASQKARRPDNHGDDFDDLEDQLQEVLEASAPVDDDSSDSDDGIYSFLGSPIVIDIPDSKKTNIRQLSTNTSLKKPMSLRELYGGNRNDDFSSSEEE